MRRSALALLLVLLATSLAAQKKQLTVEALYDPATRVSFSGLVQGSFDWIDDQSFVWPHKNQWGKFDEWRVFDVKTGKQRPLIDRAKVTAALEKAGLAADAAKTAAESDTLVFDAKKSAVVFSAADDLWLYSFATGAVTRVTTAAGEEEEPAFSPDGARIAFVRNGNLYIADLRGNERQLTFDGGPMVLNGKLDWVYQEEIYGRGIFKGHWWSPDSARIAFLQLDERQVPEYTIVDHIPYRPDLERYPYPKAGDNNPKVKLMIVGAAGGPVTTVDNERYAGAQPLIVNVAWSGDEKTLTYQVQDREQTWLDLNFVSPGGAPRTVVHETTKAWVDPLANPTWLDDGTFLWQSERSGFRHVYHYRPDGTLVRQVTSGEWEVREVHGEDAGFVYFSGTERSPIGQDVYRIRLDGSGLERLSAEAGTHAATFSPSLVHYVDKWSDIRTPDQIRVRRGADGKEVHVVEANRVDALAAYDIPRPELLQVKTRDGFVMEAMLIKPTNFDPSKKYPVFHHVYSGPHAQRVRNIWDSSRSTRGLFHHLIAQQGVIVWVCDNRTASGKGAQSAWPIYKNAGEWELRDQEDGIAWLEQQPWVDGSRILIQGWSYGGFMAAYAMTHSKTWSAGIAGAPVTDWRDYDSVYTERYMLMPKNNPDGYRKTAPRFAAKDLYGRLLLIHGTVDDNVHLQNTIQFAYELQQAGKPFEMMVYAKQRHAFDDEALLLHLQRTVLDFVRRQLLATASQLPQP